MTSPIHSWGLVNIVYEKSFAFAFVWHAEPFAFAVYHANVRVKLTTVPF